MNCLEIKKSFASFWAKEMADDQRREFVGHLSDCSACDRAFRIFVLTAPVLHGSAGLNGQRRTPLKPGRAGASVQLARGRQLERRWALTAAAIAVSAAAAVTVYIARPPAPTLEDAILQNAGSEADPGVHLTNYDSGLFASQDSEWSASRTQGAFDFTGSNNAERSRNGLGG